MESLSKELQVKAKHAVDVRRRCLVLEGSIADVEDENDASIVYFPVTISR